VSARTPDTRPPEKEQGRPQPAAEPRRQQPPAAARRRLPPLVELLVARLRQGHRTHPFPRVPVELPARFRGRPALAPERCGAGCSACADACPVGAITVDPLRLDLGACLFCPGCEEACPDGAITFGNDHRLAATARGDLLVDGGEEVKLAQALSAEMCRVFGRSIRLRQVSAGGCNACEVEVNVLNTLVFDLARFGIQFVASPRHADGILVTGTVTANMRQAVLTTWEAVPAPRLAIALGACAIAGGPFRGSTVAGDGVPAEIPVSLYVPGCPPHPYTILDGLLRLLGRMEGVERLAPVGGPVR
jgi:Ni,Fe-hydrogenase III small subunit/NAD-dependent dihydropyrimidine dehydrogenase PreA subunit